MKWYCNSKVLSIKCSKRTSKWPQWRNKLSVGPKYILTEFPSSNLENRRDLITFAVCPLSIPQPAGGLVISVTQMRLLLTGHDLLSALISFPATQYFPIKERPHVRAVLLTSISYSFAPKLTNIPSVKAVAGNREQWQCISKYLLSLEILSQKHR